jgi:hypothetical protein
MEITYDNFHSLAHSFLALLAISLAGARTLSNRLAASAAIPHHRLDDGGIVWISHRIDTPAGKNSSCNKRVGRITFRVLVPSSK